MRGNAIQIAKLVNAQPQRDQYRKLQLARSPVAKKLQQEIELPLETQYTKDQLRGECGIAVGERVGGGQQFVTRVFPRRYTRQHLKRYAPRWRNRSLGIGAGGHERGPETLDQDWPSSLSLSLPELLLRAAASRNAKNQRRVLRG